MGQRELKIHFATLAEVEPTESGESAGAVIDHYMEGNGKEQILNRVFRSLVFSV